MERITQGRPPGDSAVKRTATKPSLRILGRSVPVFLIEDNRLLI